MSNWYFAGQFTVVPFLINKVEVEAVEVMGAGNISCRKWKYVDCYPWYDNGITAVSVMWAQGSCTSIETESSVGPGLLGRSDAWEQEIDSLLGNEG